MTSVKSLCSLVCFSMAIWSLAAALKEEDCEVCFKVINKFQDENKDLRDKSLPDIEKAIMKFCKNLKGKEERFCYYVGGLDISATSILGQISKPFKNYFPTEKICEKLKSANVCELKYEKKIDLMDINFKKLKVKDLKKILSDWDEDKACKGCSEKADFVSAVKELLPKYAPEAAKKLKEREEL